MNRKIVINRCWGGFGLSAQAVEEFCVRRGIDPGPRETWMFSNWQHYPEFHEHDIPRDDPDLVAVVQALGDQSWGFSAELHIVEVPWDVDWVLCENDGMEWIAERHRTWR